MRTLIVLLTLALAACGMNRRIQQVSPGMTQDRVIATMGTPDGMISEGEYVALQWANRTMSGWSTDRADYWVILQDGRVVAYGPGVVRHGPQPNTLLLVPLTR